MSPMQLVTSKRRAPSRAATLGAVAVLMSLGACGGGSVDDVVFRPVGELPAPDPVASEPPAVAGVGSGPPSAVDAPEPAPSSPDDAASGADPLPGEPAVDPAVPQPVHADPAPADPVSEPVVNPAEEPVPGDDAEELESSSEIVVDRARHDPDDAELELRGFVRPANAELLVEFSGREEPLQTQGGEFDVTLEDVFEAPPSLTLRSDDGASLTVGVETED